MDKNYGKLDRGMPLNIPVSVFDVNEKPIDLANQQIYFTIKSQKFDFDRDDRHAFVSKQYAADSVIKNQFIIKLSAKDMDFEPGEYYFDIVIGGWRAISLSFTLVGGPTNRSVLDENENKGQFSSLKRPIMIIKRQEKPIIIISDFNPYLRDIEERISKKKFLPMEIKKVPDMDMLYEFWYDAVDTSIQSHQSTDKANFGACSVVAKYDFIGRNFDWLYDNTVTCIVHTRRHGSRFATFGVGRYSTITEELIQSDPENGDFSILPNYIVDGVNEYGLYANTNVTSTDYGLEPTRPKIENRERVENLCLIRYILDNFKTAEEAFEYIRDYVEVFPSEYLLSEGELLHVLLRDSTQAFVMEFINGEVVKVNFPYMTNFNLYKVDVNNDGTVYTPETQDKDHDAIKINNVSENGVGLERFNIIAKQYYNIETKESFENLLKDLRYTRTYLSSARPSNPFWYTEAVGGKLKVNSPLADFAEAAEIMDEMYKLRSRDNPKTWQTVHSCIYDMKRKKMYIKTQEKEKEKEFILEF